MKKINWIWMPHPGHLIVSRDCGFHLNTFVGNYIVSTVGEYLPDEGVLKIFALSRNYPLTLSSKGDAVRYNFIKENGGFEELGFGRRYETMVFKARREQNKDAQCCPWAQSGSELEMDGYNDPVSALKGHLRLCKKWANKK